ncbi:hypothetical protein [Sphingobacterium cavernae]|uniref:hypothetical protein n=1 Tax=Sphingobacterium cavernae TaxID=2592657 RepID=UPI00122FC53F|nr:hypothetical protein [Sphingobacterium cavernae]
MKEILIIISFLLSISTSYCQIERFTHLEGGILTYGPETMELGLSFRGVNAWKYTDKFSAGLGVGYEKYTFNENEGNPFKALPLFTQAKYILCPDKSKSLYGAFDLGYSLSLNKSEESTNTKKSYKGGLLASPQLGLLWYMNKDKKSHITLSFGYKYQRFTENIYFNNIGWMFEANDFSSVKNVEILSGYDNYTKSKYNLHRLSVMLGIGF